MNIIDIILLVILAYFLFKGARVGFIRLIGGFGGIVLGALAAGMYYQEGADWLMGQFDLQLVSAIVIAFISIYIIVNLIIGTTVSILSKVFRIIPLATTTNRIIGAVLGLLQGLLLVGLIIWIINLFPFDNSFSRNLKESRVAEYFEASTRLVQPLLPESLREVDFSFLENLRNLTDEKAEYLQENMPDFFSDFKERSLELEQKVHDAVTDE